MNYVFGYTVAHDVSARDWQLESGKNGGQWLIGKAMDGFCPLGPAIVMKEDINGMILIFCFCCYFYRLFLWRGRGGGGCVGFFSQSVLLANVD